MTSWGFFPNPPYISTHAGVWGTAFLGGRLFRVFLIWFCLEAYSYSTLGCFLTRFIRVPTLPLGEFHLNRKICSSNSIMIPSRDEYQTSLKSPPTLDNKKTFQTLDPTVKAMRFRNILQAKVLLLKLCGQKLLGIFKNIGSQRNMSNWKDFFTDWFQPIWKICS